MEWKSQKYIKKYNTHKTSYLIDLQVRGVNKDFGWQ